MPVNINLPRFRFYMAFMAMLVWVTLLAGTAMADYDFPRLGLSVVSDDYVENMNAQMGDTFVVYVGIYGSESGMVLEEDMLYTSWVVHQVCCGGTLVVLDYEFVGEFVSEGHPLAGVNSVAPHCISADYIPLAVLTVTLETPDGPGDYQMSAGPYGPSSNCAGESPIFLEGVVTVSAGGVPVVETSWSDVKALYR